MQDQERRSDRDLLVEIRTKLDLALTRQDDHESRLRDLYQRLTGLASTEDVHGLARRLPDYVTKTELRSMRTHTIAVITTVVVVVGAVVGLVAALT